MVPPTNLCLINLSDAEDYSVIPPEGLSHDARAKGCEQYISSLNKINSFWTAGSVDSSCPHPVLITERHQKKLVELQRALDLALEDIIVRWWTDEEAQFPQRMPIMPEEESLLRWIDANQHICGAYRQRKGSWRPDFLVEQDESGEENFRICEINARFCWNGFMMIGCAQRALDTFELGRRGLIHATDPDVIFKGLLSLFDNKKPLYLVKGEEHGYDIFMFLEYARDQMGLELHLISPNDLRLVPDPTGFEGYKLCCVAGAGRAGAFTNESEEALEDVHQVCLELHQREFHALEPAMQRQVSLRCFNDMRTILLAHDKRMLGIIREELDSLTSRGILSLEQADCLRQGITDSILPGSSALAVFVQSCKESETLKNEYILKPIRGGKGAGILFGDEISNSDWLAHLGTMDSAEVRPKGTSYVVQRQIRQQYYDVFLGSEVVPRRCHMVGTFHVINGAFLGLGIWRCGPGRLCAISTGASWMTSVMKQT